MTRDGWCLAHDPALIVPEEAVEGVRHGASVRCSQNGVNGGSHAHLISLPLLRCLEEVIAASDAERFKQVGHGEGFGEWVGGGLPEDFLAATPLLPPLPLLTKVSVVPVTLVRKANNCF